MLLLQNKQSPSAAIQAHSFSDLVISAFTHDYRLNSKPTSVLERNSLYWISEAYLGARILSEDTSKERIKRYRKGIQEILKTRNYTFIEDIESEKGVDFFAEHTEMGETIKVVVRVPMKSTVGVQEIRTLNKFKETEELDEAIIVAEDRFTHYARKEAIAVGIEVFESHHPMFNIFCHSLVPTHERLTEKEKRSVLKQFNIQVFQLPKIKRSDPAVKNINAKPGDVVRILREGMDQLNFASYRLVVDDR